MPYDKNAEWYKKYQEAAIKDYLDQVAQTMPWDWNEWQNVPDTPPSWEDKTLSLVPIWLELERLGASGKLSAKVQALCEFKKLELHMNKDDIQATEESRIEYIGWLAKQKKTNWQPAPVTEKDVRDSLPLLNQMIQAGYRAMAKQAHPDTGGSTEQFMELKKVRDVLDNLAEQVKGLV